jgi:preprotein translocase subunit SecE
MGKRKESIKIIFDVFVFLIVMAIVFYVLLFA